MTLITSIRRRTGPVAAGLAIAVLAAAPAPASAAEPLYDGECIDGDRADQFRPVVDRPAGSVEVWTMPSTAIAAREYDDFALPLYRRYRALFDGRPPRTDPALRIYVVRGADYRAPNQETDERGVHGEYCTGPLDPREYAVVVRADLSSAVRRTLIAHELFHAFQDVPGNRALGGGWWAEATAVWAEYKFAPPVPHADTRDRDDAFIHHPELKLDLFEPGGSVLKELHPYGAFRFVQWLRRPLGVAGRFALLKETFARISRGQNDTDALEDELREGGRELHDLLARFWADHLDESGPGPRSEPIYPRSELISPTTEPIEIRRHAGPLKTLLMRWRVPRSVEQLSVEIKVPPSSPKAHLWVLVGPDREEWREVGDGELFCVNAPMSAVGQPWSGGFRAAFTNGDRSDPQEVTLKVHALEASCEIPSDPSPPARCPRTVRNFSAASFPERYVWWLRTSRILNEYDHWSRDVGVFPERGEYAYVGFARTQATALCALRRLDRVQQQAPADSRGIYRSLLARLDRIAGANGDYEVQCREHLHLYEQLLGRPIDVRTGENTCYLPGPSNEELHRGLSSQIFELQEVPATRQLVERCLQAARRFARRNQDGRHPCLGPRQRAPQDLRSPWGSVDEWSERGQ